MEAAVDRGFGELGLKTYDIGGRDGTRRVGELVAEQIRDGHADPV